MEVRPFARPDREQLARLVNAHAAVVVPGAYVPPATLLNDLERPLGEYIVNRTTRGFDRTPGRN